MCLSITYTADMHAHAQGMQYGATKTDAILTSLEGQARVSFAGDHYKEGEDDAHHCHPFKEGPDEGGQCADTPKTCMPGELTKSERCFHCLPEQMFMQRRTAASMARQGRPLPPTALIPWGRRAHVPKLKDSRQNRVACTFSMGA